MATFQLHATKTSPYCQSVRTQLLWRDWTCDEFFYSWKDLNDDSKNQELKTHPKAQVPQLRHGQVSVTDSFFITAYLEEIFCKECNWLATSDAMLFRTAEVELRDLLVLLYFYQKTRTKKFMPLFSWQVQLEKALRLLQKFHHLLSESPSAGKIHTFWMLSCIEKTASAMNVPLGDAFQKVRTHLGEMTCVKELAKTWEV
jgi:glutathione S-transferase